MEPAPTPNVSKRPWLRIGLVLLMAVALGAVARLTGLDEYLDKERVRALMESAGWWGFLLFIVIFALGELIHIPGLVFVGAALLVFDRFTGTVLSLVGAVISVTVSFVVVRRVGGQALADLEKPLLRRMLARLEERPVRTVALLRLIFWMAPPVNYALAMTRVRLWDYVVGSTLGLIVPLVAIAFFFDYIMLAVDWLLGLFS